MWCDFRAKLIYILGVLTVLLQFGLETAYANPIYRYTASGTLTVKSGVFPDAVDFEGASYTAIYDVDPIESFFVSGTAPGIASARYLPISLNVTIANRPNTASDFSYSFAPGFMTLQNFFPPRSDNDLIALPGGFATNPAPGIVGLDLPRWKVAFDQGFFSGVGVPELPIFTSAEIISSSSNFLTATSNSESSIYRLLNPKVVSQLIPEPDSLALFMIALSVLGFSRWQKKRR